MEPRLEEIRIQDLCKSVEALLGQTRLYLEILSNKNSYNLISPKEPEISKKLKTEEEIQPSNFFEDFKSSIEPLCSNFVKNLLKSKFLCSKKILSPSTLLREIESFNTEKDKKIIKMISEKKPIFIITKTKKAKLRKPQEKRILQKKEEKINSKRGGRPKHLVDNCKQEEDSQPYFFPNNSTSYSQNRFFSTSSAQISSIFRDDIEEEPIPSTTLRFRTIQSNANIKSPEEFLNIEETFPNFFTKESSTREESPRWDKYEKKGHEFEKELSFLEKNEYD